jgi:hypothetical protein
MSWNLGDKKTSLLSHSQLCLCLGRRCGHLSVLLTASLLPLGSLLVHLLFLFILRTHERRPRALHGVGGSAPDGEQCHFA